MLRNPNWTRDELILALDLYFKLGAKHAAEKHPDVIALSNLLNRLPIHRKDKVKDSFRNPASIDMKLRNFVRLDADYIATGLSGGAKLDQVIWNEFSGNNQLLRDTAIAIRATYQDANIAQTFKIDAAAADIEEEEFLEGGILTRVHTVRERNSSAVKKKKQQVLETIGALVCEVCGFDFQKVYGELGAGFAECHHVVPLSHLRQQSITRLEDLAIVCANCHRMLHRGKQIHSIADLKAKIVK